MANSTTNIDTVVQSQSSKEVTINAYLDAASPATVYGRRASTTAFPVWGYYGGNVTLSGGSLAQIANATLSLTSSNTNYIVALKSSGAVSASTSNTNWNDTTNYWRLYSVVLGASAFTSYSDARELGKMTGGGGTGSGSPVTVKNEGSSLTTALASLDFVGVAVNATTSGDAVTVTISAREMLVADRTYYVRTDGSNSNNGLSNTSGGAFLTIQKAVDVVYQTLDLGIYNVIVQIADGTYSGAVVVAGPLIGSGSLTIQGNSGTPTNVISSTGSSINFTVKTGAVVTIKDLKITNTGNLGLYSTQKAHINFSGIDFGSVSTYQIRADDYGTITAAGNYTISGGAAGHINCVAGEVRVQARTITLSGTPAFSVAFIGCSYCSVGIQDGNTYSGSATGVRYSASMNGVIFTNGGGANYFPGNSAGTTATGGQYA
jgi:hypothetical protein